MGTPDSELNRLLRASAHSSESEPADMPYRPSIDVFFHSVAELEAAIEAYMENHNADPKPFIWTGKADDIRLSRHCQQIANIRATQMAVTITQQCVPW